SDDSQRRAPCLLRGSVWSDPARRAKRGVYLVFESAELLDGCQNSVFDRLEAAVVVGDLLRCRPGKDRRCHRRMIRCQIVAEGWVLPDLRRQLVKANCSCACDDRGVGTAWRGVDHEVGRVAAVLRVETNFLSAGDSKTIGRAEPETDRALA